MFDLENPKLLKLAEIQGMEVMDMLEEAIYDSICPAICMECDATYDYEPDQDRGWCEECKKNTVKSALIIARII